MLANKEVQFMSSYQAIYTEQLVQEIEHTPDEYLPMLLQIVRLFRQSITLKPAVDSFRQGWQEVIKGEILPIETLWVGKY
jgi:hypothetical protein